jgi:hypothetical protein
MITRLFQDARKRVSEELLLTKSWDLRCERGQRWR